jgi:hypothetical protein
MNTKSWKYVQVDSKRKMRIPQERSWSQLLPLTGTAQEPWPPPSGWHTTPPWTRAISTCLLQISVTSTMSPNLGVNLFEGYCSKVALCSVLQEVTGHRDCDSWLWLGQIWEIYQLFCLPWGKVTISWCHCDGHWCVPIERIHFQQWGVLLDLCLPCSWILSHVHGILNCQLLWNNAEVERILFFLPDAKKKNLL